MFNLCINIDIDQQGQSFEKKQTTTLGEEARLIGTEGLQSESM